jgi:hypothetical protein
VEEIRRGLKSGYLLSFGSGRAPFYLLLVLSLAFAVIGPENARAQIAADAKKFMSGAENRAAVDKALRAMASSLMPNCRSIDSDGKFNAKVYVPLEFSSEGDSLVKGAWKEEAVFNICGTKRQLNILNLATSQGVQRRMLLPGTSIGDPVLQRDGLLYAQAGASRKIARDCKARIVDTRFSSFDPPASTGKRPWHEIWVVDACGNEVPVEMTFIPDATGTTISSKLK